MGLHANDSIVGEDPQKGPEGPSGERLEAIVSLYALVQHHSFCGDYFHSILA